MRILCVMMKYDYGERKRGYSFEYDTFYIFFKSTSHTVKLFDYMTLMQQHGKADMNRLLLNICAEYKPHLIFTTLFRDELADSTLATLRDIYGTSVVFMMDDQWRWKSYSRKKCWLFNFVITTYPDAVMQYKSIGYNSVILSQYGINSYIYKKLPTKKTISVSFVGMANPWRVHVVNELNKRGIPVQCFGHGWNNGRVSLNGMVEIFNNSKINLNISNSVQINMNYLLSINFYYDRHKNILENIYTIFGAQIDTLLHPKRQEQIKARFFEVTGSGGFLLSYHVKYLERYFKIGQEIVCYKDVDDLASKIIYYLYHNSERNSIAKFGYQRTILEHTYKKRFLDVFSHIFRKGENIK